MSKRLPAVGVADHAGNQLEHIAHQLADDLFQRGKLAVRHEALPRTDIFSRDCPVLHQGVSHQPAGADAQEMVHGLRRIPGPDQLLLQRGERVLPEALMDAAVPVKALVADGEHIGLLIRKVLHCVALEIFDSLLACPLAVLFFLLLAG